jgi:phage shock protein A
MTAPAEQREHAAHLYLMAGDAFARGDSDLAEMLIKRANQYADQAAGLQSCGREQRQHNE